eukprot:5031280-Amphidinium_carterae.2
MSIRSPESTPTHTMSPGNLVTTCSPRPPCAHVGAYLLVSAMPHAFMLVHSCHPAALPPPPNHAPPLQIPPQQPPSSTVSIARPPPDHAPPLQIPPQQPPSSTVSIARAVA